MTTQSHPQENGTPETESATESVRPDTGAVDPEAAATIARLEVELAEVKDKYLRLAADMENLRRRTEREKQDTAKYAVSSFAREMLGVADNLKRALEAIAPAQRAQDESLNNIYTGVEMTARVLMQAMESNGIKAIDPLGQVFDPNLHEVMFEAPAPAPAGTVIQVIETGYTIHDRLLRPARVGVAASGGTTAAGDAVDQEI